MLTLMWGVDIEFYPVNRVQFVNIHMIVIFNDPRLYGRRKKRKENRQIETVA